MQFQYYAQSTMGRLSGTSDPESTDSYSQGDQQSHAADIDVGAATAAPVNGCWRIGRGDGERAGTAAAAAGPAGVAVAAGMTAAGTAVRIVTSVAERSAPASQEALPLEGVDGDDS